MGVSLVCVVVGVACTYLHIVVNARIRQNALSVRLSAQVDFALKFAAAVVARAILRNIALVQTILAGAAGHTPRLTVLLEAYGALVGVVCVGARRGCHVVRRLLMVLAGLICFRAHTPFVHNLHLLLLLVVGNAVELAVNDVLLAARGVLLELFLAVGGHPLLRLLLLMLEQVRWLVLRHAIVIRIRPLLRICDDNFLS